MAKLPPVPFKAQLLDSLGFLAPVWADWFNRAQVLLGGSGDSTPALGVPTGAGMLWWSATAPSGWLLLEDKTLGSSASGADFAGGAYRALYERLWSDIGNTELPILDSSGSASTRGASAAEDFAADKRLPLPNPAGLVLRTVGSQAIDGNDKVGPSVGEKQADQFQGHWHTVRRSTTRAGLNSGGSSGIQLSFVSTTSLSNTDPGFIGKEEVSNGVDGTPRFGAETRAAAFGVRWIIKL